MKKTTIFGLLGALALGGCATVTPAPTPDALAIQREYMELRSMLWTDDCYAHYVALKEAK